MNNIGALAPCAALGTAWAARTASAAAGSAFSLDMLATESTMIVGDTQEIASLSLEEMLQQRYPGSFYHVFDASSSNWLRNDFPHHKIFNKNADTDAIQNWKPSGPEPEYTKSAAIKALSGVPAGQTAIIIHPDLQARMQDDPELAREIFDRIDAWFTFDQVRNEAIMPGISLRSSRCVAIGADGNICNAMSFSHGELTYSGDPGGRDSVSAWDARMKRHDYYMKRHVDAQIEQKAMMSQQLEVMGAQKAMQKQLVSLMRDQSFVGKLGTHIAGIPISKVFEATNMHVFGSASIPVL